MDVLAREGSAALREEVAQLWRSSEEIREMMRRTENCRSRRIKKSRENLLDHFNADPPIGTRKAQFFPISISISIMIEYFLSAQFHPCATAIVDVCVLCW